MTSEIHTTKVSPTDRMRILLNEEPYLPAIANCAWINQGIWPCSWIASPAGSPVSAFRLRFRLQEAASIRAHVTADERYELYVDGTRAGRGPERGDPRHWFFETYEIPLAAGEHTIVARTWALGPASMRSQMSLAPGFLFSPDRAELIPLLGTGLAEWEVKPLPGYEFHRPFFHNFFSIGYGTMLKGSEYDWDWPGGGGSGWKKADVMHPGSSATLRNRYAPTVHLLEPATLPPMHESPRTAGKVRHISASGEEPVTEALALHDEESIWTDLITNGAPLEVPPMTTRRIILDLEGYECAYPRVRLRGGDGGRFQIFWAESLFLDPEGQGKGNRDEIEGKFFIGYGDVFCPSGTVPRDYESLYWRSGRYLEILVQTAAEPMWIDQCGLLSTRYPLETEVTFSSSDPSLEAMIPLGLRALQSSCHDSYMDGPYYEQMMWLGDGVQNALTTYVSSHDDRLARKLLRLFDSSRLPSGLTAARWPARDTLVIAPYSLLWISLVRDYAFWKDDPAFVQSLLPGVRAVVEAFFSFLNPDGLMQPPMGWNFIDWVPGWPDGMPPGSQGVVNGILNLQMLRTLGYVAELEDSAGEFELAQRARRKASLLAQSIEAHLWDEGRGLFADTPDKSSFSEHAQAEAIMSGFIPSGKIDVLRRTLFEDESLARTTISYTHYLFEAYRKLNRTDVMLQRMDLWRNLPGLGFHTTPEGPEPTRSDCHAWGAHPIYHFFASILGIRPATPSFRTMHIAPQLGTLDSASGSMCHPAGNISAEFRVSEGSLVGRVVLPDGITGMLQLPDRQLPLGSGSTEF